MIETLVMRELARAELYQELGAGNEAIAAVDKAKMLSIDHPLYQELDFLFNFRWPDVEDHEQKPDETDDEWAARLRVLDAAAARGFLDDIRGAFSIVGARVAEKFLERDSRIFELTREVGDGVSRITQLEQEIGKIQSPVSGPVESKEAVGSHA